MAFSTLKFPLAKPLFIVTTTILTQYDPLRIKSIFSKETNTE